MKTRPSLTRGQVSCRPERGEAHLLNDLVMLICGHTLCRSCTTKTSDNQPPACPICTKHVPSDDRHQASSRPYDSGDNHRLRDQTHARGKPCQSSNEDIKMQIIQTMDQCEQLLVKQRQSASAFEKQREELSELHQILNERVMHFCAKLNQYRQELQDLLTTQEQANEMNFMKHQPINIQSVAASIEPRLNALKNHGSFLENIHVEQEIKRIDNETDRQLRLLKHKADIVPVFSPVLKQPSANILGELLFKTIHAEPSRSNTTSMDPVLINASGDTSLQSIPPKLPMWTANVQAAPFFLCLYPHGKSTLVFSSNSSGILSVFSYLSPVTYESPRYLRTCHPFSDWPYVCVQSCTVFDRFILFHVHLHPKSSRELDLGSLFFFTHDATLEHEPVRLFTPVRQYLADESRLWGIDSLKQSIFSQAQPTCTEEILSVLSHRDHFTSFDASESFLPFRMSVNHQSLAVLAKDLQQVYIYNKVTRERIFKSQFSAGNDMNIWSMALFPRDNSLLLKFDWTREKKVQYSVFIHFNTKNQSIGRIEGKYCMGFVIGPHKEIIVGFNLKTCMIRCYT